MIFIVNLLPRQRAALPDGREWRGPNALGDIARPLIGEGADPDAGLLALRDGRPVLTGSIGTFAARAWAGAATDTKFRRWRPHPRARTRSRPVAGAPENGSLPPGRSPPTGDTLEAAGNAPAQGRE